MDNTNNIKLKQLEDKIIELEKKISSLEQSSTMPYNFIKSLEGNGFIKSGNPDVPPYTDWYLNSGFGYDIGGGAYVQAMANAYFKINDGGRDLFIPLLQLNEMP